MISTGVLSKIIYKFKKYQKSLLILRRETEQKFFTTLENENKQEAILLTEITENEKVKVLEEFPELKGESFCFVPTSR